jgi:dTDP-4-dehydrorhamnose reductase
MKILVLGANGQVGWELARELASVGPLTAWDRRACDLEDSGRLAVSLRSHAPDCIVNAAAYTAVDRAESDADRARRINADAVRTLADYAAGSGACLIHYSTDYVFDGLKDGPYLEDDATHPLNVYGQTKLAGEIAIRESGCRHFLFRTSWVFAGRGRNFPKTILTLAGERDQLRVVDDQHGAPTGARLIAHLTRAVLEKWQDPAQGGDIRLGTYHLAAAGETTWCGYARFVVGEALRLGYPLRAGVNDILAIPTSEFPQPARRPPNSRLDTSRLRAWLGVALPSWETGVAEAVGEIVSQGDTPQ